MLKAKAKIEWKVVEDTRSWSTDDTIISVTNGTATTEDDTEIMELWNVDFALTFEMFELIETPDIA